MPQPTAEQPPIEADGVGALVALVAAEQQRTIAETRRRVDRVGGEVAELLTARRRGLQRIETSLTVALGRQRRGHRSRAMSHVALRRSQRRARHAVEAALVTAHVTERWSAEVGTQLDALERVLSVVVTVSANRAATSSAPLRK